MTVADTVPPVTPLPPAQPVPPASAADRVRPANPARSAAGADARLRLPIVPAVPAGADLRVGTSNGSERFKERAVVLRVLVYVVVAHLLALFVWLLFLVGGSR